MGFSEDYGESLIFFFLSLRDIGDGLWVINWLKWFVVVRWRVGFRSDFFLFILWVIVYILDFLEVDLRGRLVFGEVFWRVFLGLVFVEVKRRK